MNRPLVGSDAAICLGSTASGVSRRPHRFAQALRKELRETHPEEEATLQHADSMLIWNPAMEAPDQSSTEVLNFLETWIHTFSQMKAQLSKQQVKYLRYVINPGSRELSPDRKQAILGLSHGQRSENSQFIQGNSRQIGRQREQL